MTRILIVEDEPSLAEPLAFLLEREGYEPTICADGLVAVAEFDRNGTDLVLLDLMLPGLSGIEVCREIRSRSAVPIIMLTAKDSEIDIVVGLELGADDYVTKPYSSRELLARIRAHTDRIFDIKCCIRPFRTKGPRLDVERCMDVHWRIRRHSNCHCLRVHQAVHHDDSRWRSSHRLHQLAGRLSGRL